MYKYIYSPHLASLAVQKKAGCIIGKDYPLPMLDEALEKERCILRIKAAYQVGLYGSDRAVLDGSADALIKEGYKAALDTLGNESQAGSKRKGEDNASNLSKKSAKTGGIEKYFSK